MLDFSKIDTLKEQLNKNRPLPPEVLQNLREVFRVDWTYHSNAIEGNTLSLLETKMVVEEGITVGGKTLREHFEAINHAEAIDFVETLVEQNSELSERIIKDLHALVLKNIDDKNAGTYRSVNVGISGSLHKPPHFLQVAEEMKRLLIWFKKNQDLLHPVELAARFHFQFVYIHPFIDGNGRTARLLMNLILMGAGFPPAIIKADREKRLYYYETLEKASVNGDLEPFILLVSECVEESLTRFLNAIS
ncbi:Fic family protein [Pueribacillus theae]|uniref:Fic family protein n=1 Tax=Pueribacillus theae TaxID=2171751 RepID=A0A2U1K7D1_9BACI|nr:Fic family protein [Pueribacillus theae]PWA13441.1 Fic family protein [Pueribacillus theae]